jgi:hypothetical protein
VLNAALLGGILNWRQNTGKIAIEGGILSLQNIVKILLFQVAYFGGEKTRKKWLFRRAYLAKKTRKYASFGGNTSVEKNMEIYVLFHT